MRTLLVCFCSALTACSLAALEQPSPDSGARPDDASAPADGAPDATTRDVAMPPDGSMGAQDSHVDDSSTADTPATPDVAADSSAGGPDAPADAGTDATLDATLDTLETGPDGSEASADGAPIESGPATGVATFDCTQQSAAFVVPQGVSRVTLKAWGAGGGGTFVTAAGGGGGFAQQAFAVTGGTTLTVQVGCPGGSTNSYQGPTTPGGWGYATGGTAPGLGWNGGGGGGASAVTGPGGVLVVAGGGGGGGGAIGDAPGGGGGGAAGTAGGTCGSPSARSGGQGGQAGSASGLGGAGAAGSGNAGGNGSATSGGAGGTCISGDGLGAGGGGGYAGGGGGGGGGSCVGGGGGGGGSNYIASSGGLGPSFSWIAEGSAAADSADPDLPAGHAQGGWVDQAASNGYVVIRWGDADAGVPVDSGPIDSGSVDSNAPDTGTMDTGSACAQDGGPPSCSLVLWLRADTLSVPNGTPITTWPDSSGLGNNATQSSPPLQPTLVSNAFGSLPAVHFASGESMMLANLVNGPFTLVAVGAATSSTEASTATFGFLGNSSDDSFVGAASGQVEEVGGGGIVASALFPNGVSFATADLWSCVWNNSTPSFWINGAATTTPSTGLAIADFNVVGANTASMTFSTGNIAEILLYAPNVSEAEREAAQSYLSQKYGL